MPKRIQELLLAMVIYFVTMFVLLMAVYHFLESWKLRDLNFFIAGVLVILVALGWGYVLTALIFAPKKQMEDTLTTLTNDILHELNIPLSTIKANTQMLRKQIEDPKLLQRIKRIEDASVRLKKLYDELVYGIRKEMHTVEKAVFDIEELVRERLLFFAEQQRNPFEIHVLSYHIEVDRIGFEQMFDNLITNAMKYSAKNSAIVVGLRGDCLTIEDHGVGMSATELLRMHERYYQADSEKDGSGIGFALVKGYCEKEGIEIDIKSQKGSGTTVCLDLKRVHV